ANARRHGPGLWYGRLMSVTDTASTDDRRPWVAPKLMMQDVELTSSERFSDSDRFTDGAGSIIVR
ncbi:MAG: hypothetical protein ACO225_15215, partial [Ilumatobacteraceae bacterium]